MTIEKIISGNTVTLKLSGWLDTKTSPELGAELDMIESADRLVLDLEKVEYVSSAGLRQVAAAARKMKALGGSFSVIHVCPDVMSIFRLTALDKRFDVQPM